MLASSKGSLLSRRAVQSHHVIPSHAPVARQRLITTRAEPAQNALAGLWKLITDPIGTYRACKAEHDERKRARQAEYDAWWRKTQSGLTMDESIAILEYVTDPKNEDAPQMVDYWLRLRAWNNGTYSKEMFSDSEDEDEDEE